MPPKRRGRKPAKKAPVPSSPEHNVDIQDAQEPQIEDKEVAVLQQEVERQAAAIKAMRHVEIEQSLTGLRLLRSYFKGEQLQTPVLDFFKENLPNVSIHISEENEEIEVQWKDKVGMDNVNGRDDIHASLLRQMSMSCPYSSSKAVKTSHLRADNLQIRDLVLEELSDSQTVGTLDTFQTPGATSQRISIGMTPKSRRLPKHGEMLLSVHGSPLGVYKEDNMEAIHESEEG